MSPEPLSWQRDADRLARPAVAAGAPTAWFEQLYAAGRRGEVDLPWQRELPNQCLVEWAQREGFAGGAGAAGQGGGLAAVAAPTRRDRAVVVGAGLGLEAGYVASLGFATTAFDVSPTAVELAAERVPGVEFVVADLFSLPIQWHQSFDLVVEIFTVQPCRCPCGPRR